MKIGDKVYLRFDSSFGRGPWTVDRVVENAATRDKGLFGIEVVETKIFGPAFWFGHYDGVTIPPVDLEAPPRADLREPPVEQVVIDLREPAFA